MAEKVNTSTGSVISFPDCLPTLFAALNPQKGVIAFQNSFRKYVFRTYDDLNMEDLIRFFCPPDSPVTDPLIQFAVGGDPGAINSVYRHFNSLGNLGSFCDALKTYLEENLLCSLRARDYLNNIEELPTSRQELDTYFNGHLPPRPEAGIRKNIERLGKLIGKNGVYTAPARPVCPPGQHITLDPDKREHECTGIAALILISLIPPPSDKWHDDFVKNLGQWVKETFFPPDTAPLVTRIDFSIVSSFAEGYLNGQLIMEFNTSEFAVYDIYNDIDLDLTEELGKTKDHTNPQKLDHNITKSRRPPNEGDDIR